MEYSMPTRRCLHWRSFGPLSLSCFARFNPAFLIKRRSVRWNHVGISGGGFRTLVLSPLATRTGDHGDPGQVFKLNVSRLDQSIITTLESYRFQETSQKLRKGLQKRQLTIKEFNLICDKTLSKCDDGLLSLKEILHFLNQTRHSIQQINSTKTSRHGLWSYLEDSIKTFIDDLTPDNYIEILASGQDVNGVWIWSSEFLRTLQGKLETVLQNDSNDDDGGQFVCRLLFYLSKPVPCCCTSSFIRSLQKQILFNLHKWEVKYLICIMEKIVMIDPPPPEALVELFYNKSFSSVCDELKSEKVDSLETSALLESYLETLLRLKPSPPTSMQQGIINEGLDWMRRDLDVKMKRQESETAVLSRIDAILAPLIKCHSRAILQFKETQKDILNEILISMDKLHQVSGIHTVLESYSNFGGRDYSKVVRILANEYFRRDEIGTLRTVNAMLEMLRTGNCLTESDLQILLKHAHLCLDTSTQTECVYLLSSLAKNNTYDPIFKRVVESLMKRGGLTSEQLFRVICSCGKFIKHLNFDRESISSSLSNGLDPEHLQQADLDHLVYFVDALMKHQYQDEVIGRILINTIFRRESELDLKTMVHCLKACLVIGGIKAIEGVIEKFERTLEVEYHSLTAEDLSYTLELLAMLNYHSNEFVEIVYTKLSKCEKELDGSSLGRIFRYMGSVGYPDDALVESLITRSREISNSISNVDVSWILWSIAKKKHHFSRFAFDDLSHNFSHSIKDVDMKSLCRFVFASGSFKFHNSRQLEEIANRVCDLKGEEVSLVGIGTLAWAFTQLDYRNDEFLNWLDSNLTNQILRKANFKTLGNLIMAFIHFKFKPNTEFLKTMVKSSDNHMERLSSFEFSCFVHGFVEFQFPVPENWFKQATDHFESNLDTFQGHTLCYVIQSLVEIGYHPSSDILDITTNSIHRQILKIEYNNLARYLEACGKSGYKPLDLISELESRIKRQGDRIHVKTSAALAFSLAICQSMNYDAMRALAWGSFDRMHLMNASQLASKSHNLCARCLDLCLVFLWGLAKGGFHGKRVFERGAKLTVEKVEDMNGNDLLYSIWAFARARQPASEFLKSATGRLPKAIASYDPYQLSSLSWALTKLEISDIKILKAIDQALEDQVMNFPIKALINVLYSFASLRYLPSSTDSVWSQLEETGFEASDGWSTVKSLLWSAFIFNKQIPRNLLLTLEEMIKTRTPLAWKGGQFTLPENTDFRPQYLPLVLYCLFALELDDSKAAELCIERINKIDVLETLNIQLSSFLTQCVLLSGSKGVKSPLSEVPQHYRNKMKDMWNEANIKKARNPPSRLLKQLQIILQGSKIKFKEMVLLPQKGVLVKILIQGSERDDEDQLFAVDICEKEDIILNQNTLTGQSLMRQKLLKGAGMNVLTILDSGFPVKHQLLNQLSEVGYPLEKGVFNMETTSLFDPDEVDEGSIMEWVDNYKDEFTDEEGADETSVKPLNRGIHL